MSFLDRVVLEKKAELAAEKRRRPAIELELGTRRMPVRSFRAALEGGNRIIAEIKKKSPNVSAFPQGSDPARLAAIYASSGAAAISIVTDARNFGTSLDDVAAVREAGGLPVLVKDFVIDPYQIVAARAAGADALLLIARLLQTDELEDLLARVHAAGMTALVECHDVADVDRAVDAGAGVVGINNRDLRTMSVMLDTTRRLAPRIPDGALCVSESGIATRAHIVELAAAGADAFLVGTSLLKAADPGAKLRELLGAPEGAGSGEAK